jgi:hypothetical protein
MAIKAVLVDMGGVIVEMENSRGFPVERLDWRGREALLHLIRHRGGHASLDDLERLVFEPWHQGYERRRDTGKEEPWGPHLSRLRKKAGIRALNLTLLEAWFRPYGEQLVPIRMCRFPASSIVVCSDATGFSICFNLSTSAMTPAAANPRPP